MTIHYAKLIAAAVLAAAVLVPSAVAVRAESSPELIAAAKKEGQLVLYTAGQRKVISQSIEMFEKRYGIKVTWVRKGSGGIIQLVEAERETKNHKADVADLWDRPSFVTWKKAGILEKYKPAGADQIAKDLIDPTWEIVPVTPLTIVMVYNTRALTKDKAPKSFKEVLDPKWQGKLTHSDPVYSGSTTAAVNILKNLYGWEFYTSLAKQKPLLVQSIGAVPRMLLTGEAQVGVVAVDADIRDFMAKGEPLDVVYPAEGVPYFTWDSGILKTGKNKNAAKLWTDFLVSKDHQAFLATQKYYPSRTDVAAAPESPKLSTLKLIEMDSTWLEKNKTAQNDKFHEIMREVPKKK